MTSAVFARVRRRLFALAAVVSTMLIVVSLAYPPSAASAVGTSSEYQPTNGGKRISVAVTGTDTLPGGRVRQYCIDAGQHISAPQQCPAPDASNPLRSIQVAIRVAQPGDVIVVQAGEYEEKLGWGARPARAAAPIVLQSAPGARVLVKGSLQLTAANYWIVSGLRFTPSVALGTGQSVVSFFGGRGWIFEKNEVYGSTGVANLLVREDALGIGRGVSRVDAAPHAYSIRSNCIRQNLSTGTHGLNHNIYLMPTIYSTGGVIERNLIAGAPRGGNIKASGSNDPAGSPRDVLIRRNTLVYSASGVITGLAAAKIEIQSNAILVQQNGNARDAAVKTYSATSANQIGVKDNLIASYAKPLIQGPGEAPVFWKRNNVQPSVALVGGFSNCTVRLADPALAARYGATSTAP